MVPILSLFDGHGRLYAEDVGAALAGALACMRPWRPIVCRAPPMSGRSLRTPKEREIMKILLCTSATLLVVSTAALGQQPGVYPLRSQSAAAQGVDSAYCYWQAKQQTGVDMTRLSQKPPRQKAVRFAPDAGRGASEPPLPPPAGMGGGKAGGSATVANGASSPVAAYPAPSPSSSPAANVASASAAAPGASATASPPGSAAASGAAGAAGKVASASGAASTGLPPLPPPEPPMATYWHAYGDCMQSRGYGVQ